MSRRLIVILVIGAIALIWGWLDGPAARQERGMKDAHALQLQLQPRLNADPRFAAQDQALTLTRANCSQQPIQSATFATAPVQARSTTARRMHGFSVDGIARA